MYVLHSKNKQKTQHLTNFRILLYIYIYIYIYIYPRYLHSNAVAIFGYLLGCLEHQHYLDKVAGQEVKVVILASFLYFLMRY